MNIGLVLVAPLLWMASEAVAAVRLLKCNSVNQVPTDGLTEYVFISMKKDECVFIFEGPEGSKLNIEVKSITFSNEMSTIHGCKKSKLTLYNYVDSKVALGKLLCDSNEKTNVLTKSNMGVVTSTLSDGSFSLKIRPTLSNDEDLANEISGMLPPNSEAKDFFFIENRSNDIDDGFKPLVWTETKNFKPSAPLPPTTAEAEFIGPNYNSQEPGRHHFYPGRPTAHIDLTYNSTGLNFTVSSPRPPRPHHPSKPGHHQAPTTTSQLVSTATSPESSTKPSLSNISEAFVPTIPTRPTGRPSPVTTTSTTEPPDEE